MNRYQRILLAVIVVNLALLGMFPPYDFVPAVKGGPPVFEGFGFVVSDIPNRVVNTGFLYLSMVVVLVNGGIGWLLLERRSRAARLRRFNLQAATLLVTGLNLVLVMLFPPMENVASMTNAILPSFEGFFFIFGDSTGRTIVMSILYLEACFILVNGGLLALFFRPRDNGAEMSRLEARYLAREIHRHAGPVGSHRA